MSIVNYRRGFFAEALIGIAALVSLTFGCGEKPTIQPPHIEVLPSYGMRKSRQTFENVLNTIRHRKDFEIYTGSIDSIFEDEYGTIPSAMLSTEKDKVQLQLGAGSYEVTDTVHSKEEALTGLFDPRGEPLILLNCRPGDCVGVVHWQKDQKPEKGGLPVRAFGNYTRNYFMTSAGLARYLGFTKAGLKDGDRYVAGIDSGGKPRTCFAFIRDAQGTESTEYFESTNSNAIREWLIRINNKLFYGEFEREEGEPPWQD